MQKSKVGLDFTEVEHARDVARRIAGQVQDFVEDYTTVAVERTLCRFLGIDGIDDNDVLSMKTRCRCLMWWWRN